MAASVSNNSARVKAVTDSSRAFFTNGCVIKCRFDFSRCGALDGYVQFWEISAHTFKFLDVRLACSHKILYRMEILVS